MRREATGSTAPGWRVDCGGEPDAAGAWEVRGPDVTPRAKREARRRERAEIPPPLVPAVSVAGGQPSSRGSRRSGGRRPASPAGRRRRPAPEAPASWRWGDGRRGQAGRPLSRRRVREEPSSTHSNPASSRASHFSTHSNPASSRASHFSTHPNPPVSEGAGAAHPLPGPGWLWRQWKTGQAGHRGASGAPAVARQPGLTSGPDIYPERWRDTPWDHTTTVHTRDIC